MNQPIPTGPDLFGFAQSSYEKARSAGSDPENLPFGSPAEVYHFTAATLHTQQAQTAALVMVGEIIASATGVHHNDLEAWREKIGLSWLKECRARHLRRPQCEERHTQDCAYADPVPEPPHVLLPIGTRVLVSDWEREEDRWGDGYTLRLKNPQVGKITGYDMHRSKYRWRQEWEPGRYSTTDSWAFVDNRVEIHPDGPECPEKSAS